MAEGRTRCVIREHPADPRTVGRIADKIRGGKRHNGHTLLDRKSAHWRHDPHPPLFGVAPFTPASPCPHFGPMPRHTSLVCMVCNETGWAEPKLQAERRAELARQAKAERHAAAEILAAAIRQRLRLAS